jgi:carboxyl-terminal processing protease
MEENKEKVQNKKLEIIQPLLLGLVLAIGILFGYKMNDKSDRFITAIGKNQGIKIGRIEEILRHIETRYVDPIDEDAMMDDALTAIMNRLDPHSIYVPENELREINENMSGEFLGLGIEFQYIRDTPTIITYREDGAAAKSGIRQFDQIIKINDSLVIGKTYENQLRDIIINSEVVKIEYKQKGSKETLIKNIRLTELPLHSANIGYMVNASTGYIMIEQFSDNTYKEFMDQFEDLYQSKRMRNLIIDLRGNPGGYLPEATKILNQLFTEKDQMLVYTVGRKNARQDYKTNGKAFFPELNKIAILVDENSASGSEVIAGAIQDHDRGIIIGRKTFGKGLVQEQYNLASGAALRLTTARYYTPSGRSIQKKYTDLEEYEAEVDNRSKFVISKRDSSAKVFYTLKLKRKVYDKGGIDPDVFIKADSIESDEDFQHLSYFATAFLTEQVMGNKISLKTKPNFEALSKEFVASIANTRKAKNIRLSFLKNTSDVLKYEYEYIKSNGDVLSRLKAKNVNDPFIKSALDYTEGRIKLK